METSADAPPEEEVDFGLEAGALPEAVAEAPPATFAWRRTWVDDRPALYGVAEPTAPRELSQSGAPLPAGVLHGWGLRHRAYPQSIHPLLGPRWPVVAAGR